ncbi:7,8-didemethyl-8-hydroxy-5-deazariboflavin synthase subunit CofH [Ancylothrix sp. C2]|uniref:7,8-didemethyl-8-hydroxy-5-deazariboflavin synthase subunit CofH n=1 Tax=Ancylothrix sp. D3o TaxID=2953691 RepID=UPI0021BB251A|nr:7,8-didemethyl-8-hydroxy-5-deazariboflavin synthase subunit CofH [Ancylothrix sp. D3o]MCT7950823.1 7,8-didemethyl-8-hydroxy-5-deazariboflavin synthase subunit CofH [Ancylothrix sp. D3o]
MNSVNAILNRALAGIDISPEEAVILLAQKDPEPISAIQQTADQLRQKQAGDTVTYVLNRNINFTNICEQHCSFCAFRRDAEEEGAFWLDFGKILEKTAGAVAENATEICMQGGLNTEAKIGGSSLQFYVQLVETIKKEFPHLHLHAFSPQEVQFIAREDNLSYAEVIATLRDAGVGSMPGTAAEVLVDEVRRVICPEKINSATWLEIVGTAHQLGLPTTSTMLCGHIETPPQQIQHLNLLRELQKKAVEKQYPAKITEFILLPFVGAMAPAPLRRRVGRDQPVLSDTLLLTAVSRIFLGNWISNHQPSWVKLGLAGAVEALNWGCNDIGGTLMEEHITTMAGAVGGTCKTPQELRGAIESLNRPHRQRDTLYNSIGHFLSYSGKLATAPASSH